MEWIKRGCLGCVALVVVLVLAAAAVTGMAWLGAQDNQAERLKLEPELPASPPTDEALEETAVESGTELGLEELAPLPEAGSSGRVVLDISRCELQIRAAEPGEPMRVEAHFDPETHELVQTLDEGATGWTYEVRFGSTGGGLGSMLKSLFTGIQPKVEVFLPRDRLMDLELDFTQGGAEIDLGGLWLRDVALDSRQGGAAVRFSEPPVEPMRSLSVTNRMGGLAVMRVGQASPSNLTLSCSMGGLDADLRGSWQNDADVRIDVAMGGGSVRLPEGVAVQGLGRRNREGPGPDAPTLRFTVDAEQGELEVR